MANQSKSLGTLSVDMVLQTAGFEDGMTKAERIADQKTRRIEQQARERAKAIEDAWTNMARSMAAPLAGAFSVAGVSNMITGVANLGDEIAKMSTRTGIAAGELSKLRYAGSLADVTSEDLGSSLTRLNKIMGESAGGSKEAQAALARFGIAPNASNALEAFRQIADRVKNTSDETRTASALNDVFGKSYATLIPLLKGGSDGLKLAGDELERMGGVMSGELAAASEQLNDNFTRLGTQLTAIKVNIVTPLMPLLLELSNNMVESARSADTLSGSGFALKTIFEAVAVVGVNTSYVIKQIGNELGGMAAQVDRLAHLDFQGFSAIGEMMKQDAEQARKEIDALTERLLNPPKLSIGTVNTTPAGSTGPGITAATPVTAKAISAGQQLIEQMRQRLAVAQHLTEVEKLGIELSEAKYAKTTPAERDIALSLAEQIDFRSEIARQLDDEIAAHKKLLAQYEQEANRLQQLVAQTPYGQNLQRMQDEALAESALLSGKIDTSTYDAIIAKLHEVKDTGDDVFKELQSAIEGWGKASADAIVEFAFTGKSSFSDMTTSILKDIAKMTIYQTVTKPAANWLSENIGKLFTSANGNVFSDAPGLHQYVNTVQTSPKVFGFGKLHGFANGGVFAEAGPEAVMPLARDGQGRLGVRAQGGSSNNVAFNFNINHEGTATEDTKGDPSESWRQFAVRVKGMIVEEMTNQKRPGGALYGA